MDYFTEIDVLVPSCALNILSTINNNNNSNNYNNYLHNNIWNGNQFIEFDAEIVSNSQQIHLNNNQKKVKKMKTILKGKDIIDYKVIECVSKKVFSCGKCDKKFQHLHNLKLHANIHTKNGMHMCSVEILYRNFLFRFYFFITKK